MLAGGTGVAPFMNVVATLLADAEDATLLDLVVSHRSRPAPVRSSARVEGQHCRLSVSKAT